MTRCGLRRVQGSGGFGIGVKTEIKQADYKKPLDNGPCRIDLRVRGSSKATAVRHIAQIRTHSHQEHLEFLSPVKHGRKRCLGRLNIEKRLLRNQLA